MNQSPKTFILFLSLLLASLPLQAETVQKIDGRYLGVQD